MNTSENFNLKIKSAHPTRRENEQISEIDNENKWKTDRRISSLIEGFFGVPQ